VVKEKTAGEYCNIRGAFPCFLIFPANYATKLTLPPLEIEEVWGTFQYSLVEALLQSRELTARASSTLTA
jgi:hypothetical protein